MKTICYGSAVKVSWEKGKNCRTVQYPFSGEKFSLSFKDTGEPRSVTLELNVAGASVEEEIDPHVLRELAEELWKVADIMDKRDGYPISKFAEPDPLQDEFISFLDPKKGQ